jgi:chorismate-pyruvate lyase
VPAEISACEHTNKQTNKQTTESLGIYLFTHFKRRRTEYHAGAADCTDNGAVHGFKRGPPITTHCTDYKALHG